MRRHRRRVSPRTNRSTGVSPVPSGLGILPIRSTGVSPVHKSRSQRRAFRFALHLSLLEPVLWLIVGVALVVSVWASPRMQPRVLMVHGVPPAAQQEIETHLRRLWQRQPYSVWLGTRAIERELQRYRWVAQVQVRPLIPTRLQLHLQPRVAFAKIRDSAGGQIFVDSAGVVFQPPNPPNRVSGGTILLSEGDALPSEGVLKTGTPLWRAFELLRTLSQHDAPTGQSTRTIRIEAQGELSLTCQAVGGATMRFRLGDAALYQQQAQVIQLLMNRSPAQLAQWEYVDLKSPSYPAVKPLSKGATEGHTAH